MQINKNDKNYFIYRNALKVEKILIEKISFRKCNVRNGVFYKKNNL